MVLVDDQKVVEAFTSQGPDEAFGERVRPWRPYWRLDHPGTDVGAHGVERGGEFRVAISDQEPDGGGPLAEVHDKVACMLRDPRTGRMTCNAQDVHASGVDFDHEEHIQPSQQDGVDVEEVASQPPTRLRS